ncbi:MAG TPA: putative holin-like toxin [Mobilitalea sp.]|nr:putative holin-like toxin [Mobilitalea sp.]
MQTTYETLSLMLTFGLLLTALLTYLDNRNNKRKNNCP